MRRSIALCVMALATLPAAAQTTPVGMWQTIDDKTGKPLSEVRITDNGGVLTGSIARTLQPPQAGASERCTRCTDDRRDQPLIGLEIMRQLTPSPDGLSWEGGQILDPDNGKVYRLRVQLKDAGKKLEVRGSIGPFFRTQTWVRVP